MKPKEDPADKAARLRERRVSEVEQRSAAEKNAAGLSADLRAVYGMRGFFGSPRTPAASVFGTTTSTAKKQSPGNTRGTA